MSGPRLSIIPAGAVTDRSLEPRDLQVLGLLGCYTDKSGWCRRSQVKMATQLHCGRSSVQRSLENLVTAGWVEKKRPPWGPADGQPSNSYMYRVILDRDDFVVEDAEDRENEPDESYAENATEEGQCPPVGTPATVISGSQIAAENSPEGAQHAGHPGAQPYVGTGAHTYVGTKNAPLERPPLERERDARARDRKARFLANFETRWPTSVADDRQRTAYAAETLTEAEEEPALAGIAPFLENLKRLKRDRVPAGWKYLEEKKWTLLEAQKAADAAPAGYPRSSPEVRALIWLHDICDASEGFRKIFLRDVVTYRKPMTAQILAFAQNRVPSRDEWLPLTRQQAGAWEGFFRDAAVVSARRHFKEGDRAPWPWPPSVEGKIYTAETGPPQGVLTDDIANFK